MNTENIKVRHKITNEIMTIKNITGNIVTCYIDKPYHILGWVKMDVAICHKNNLIFETQNILS